MVKYLSQRSRLYGVSGGGVSYPVIESECRLLPGGIADVIDDFGDDIDISVQAVRVKIITRLIFTESEFRIGKYVFD